ncbi:phage tail tape measure protein [Streptomyces sp. NPDC059165]|uniref:phage tail tape measure protein n=1 Tax=Streptomyces sp. NPDC059165 TaxID=3346751 RepID=UPI0036C0BAF0
MPNVGYATIQIIPSVRGISDELRRQIVGPAGSAGGDAGQAAGSSLKDKLKLGAAAAGVAAGALLVAGISKAMEQANITSTLQAQLGTSNKVAAEQGKLAGKLYGKGIGDSFQDAADAIKSVVQSGLAPPGTTNKQLESMAAKASDVATVFDQDLGGVTNAVSQMLRTGLAKNADEAFDLITKGFQSGANKADDLLDTLNEYGVQFQKAGLSGADAMGLIGQAVKAGARDADVAADAIKEFSLLAVDGSSSTAQAFNDLGLSGKAMAQGFAKGGASATKVLDLTLDRLRAVPDPVKQSRIAVALFGGKAEDLGKALYAMDPTTAAKGLGTFAGAAKKAGDTIHSGPSHEIQVFKRALEQGFVNFLGGKVLPIVSLVARGFNATLLPPIRTVASVAAGVLLPALAGLWKGGAAVVQWLKDMGTWLIPIGIAVGGFTLALTAQTVATAAVTAVFSVYRGAILAWTAVQRAATIAQAAFNAVMNANPVILVITAILALAAAVYVAWQRSETFRSVVMAAWQGIQTAALWAWNSGLKPAFEGIKVAAAAVGNVFVWLWNSVIKPVFSFISTASRILLTVLTIVVFGPIYLAVKLLGALFSWLWKVAVKPALQAIGALAMWLWNNAIKPAFNLTVAVMRVVGAGMMWLWRNVAMPVFRGIGTVISWWWQGTVTIFNAVRAFITGPLATVFRWLWNNVIKPVWNGIKAAINVAWQYGIKPVFNALKSAIGLVGKSFDTARAAIKIAWDKIKSIARGPVEFVINTVYNKGLVGVWNKVAGAFGAPKLPAYKFATGGPVFGAGTETSDDVPAWLSRNEHVWTAKEVRGAGGHGAVLALRKWAAAGGGGALPGFKDGGGLFDWIGRGVAGVGSKVWEGIKKSTAWLKDGLEASARAGVKHVVDPLLRLIPGADTAFGRMIRRIPTRILDAIFGYSKKADAKGAGGVGTLGGVIPSGSRRTIISQALAAAGVPPPGTMAQWLAGMNTLITRESGWNASAINRWDSNAKAGIPSQGLAQTIPPTWAAYVPSSLRGRGILDPVGNVAASIRYIVARYGNITRVQQANANRPPAGYDSGGWLMPGVTAAVNATGRPEAVLTARQWDIAQAALARAGTPGLQPGDKLQLVVRDRAFDVYLEAVADSRVDATLRPAITAMRANRR